MSHTPPPSSVVSTNTPDSSFLSLPIQLFEVFKDDEGFVDAVVLMLMMTLFCNASLGDQLNFMFTVFDADKDCTLSEV